MKLKTRLLKLMEAEGCCCTDEVNNSQGQRILDKLDRLGYDKRQVEESFEEIRQDELEFSLKAGV